MAQGRVHLTLEEALQLAFRDCSVQRSTAYLTDAQKKLAAELAGEALSTAIVHPYLATKDGALVGTAYVDTHRVRTLGETLLIVVDPTDRVRRVELLAFAEPPEYAPRGEWYGQFAGKRLDGELHLKRGIRGIAGASLTARATTSAVRRTLAIHAVLKTSGSKDSGQRAVAEGVGKP